MSDTGSVAPGKSRAESADGGQLAGIQTDKWTRWMIAIAVMVSAVMELVDMSAVTSSLRGYLVQQGESSAHAAHQALALVYHQLLEQAATLSYLDGFRVMGILLFIAVPFIWIMKKPQFKSPGEGAA